MTTNTFDYFRFCGDVSDRRRERCDFCGNAYVIIAFNETSWGLFRRSPSHSTVRITSVTSETDLQEKLHMPVPPLPSSSLLLPPFPRPLLPLSFPLFFPAPLFLRYPVPPLLCLSPPPATPHWITSGQLARWLQSSWSSEGCRFNYRLGLLNVCSWCTINIFLPLFRCTASLSVLQSLLFPPTSVTFSRLNCNSPASMCT